MQITLLANIEFDILNYTAFMSSIQSHIVTMFWHTFLQLTVLTGWMCVF